MSLITHRCIECGHPDFWRLALAPDNRERCPRCGHACTPGQPEVVPTFDLTGQPVEEIVKPGTATGFGVTTHSCDACKALYAELTGAAA